MTDLHTVPLTRIICDSMAKEEERRHERQALYGYMPQATAGLGQNSKNGAMADASSNAELAKEKAMARQEADARAERELSNRAWDKDDVSLLQNAVNE